MQNGSVCREWIRSSFPCSNQPCAIIYHCYKDAVCTSHFTNFVNFFLLPIWLEDSFDIYTFLNIYLYISATLISKREPFECAIAFWVLKYKQEISLWDTIRGTYEWNVSTTGTVTINFLFLLVLRDQLNQILKHHSTLSLLSSLKVESMVTSHGNESKRCLESSNHHQTKFGYAHWPHNCLSGRWGSFIIHTQLFFSFVAINEYGTISRISIHHYTLLLVFFFCILFLSILFISLNGDEKKK